MTRESGHSEKIQQFFIDLLDSLGIGANRISDTGIVVTPVPNEDGVVTVTFNEFDLDPASGLRFMKRPGDKGLSKTRRVITITASKPVTIDSEVSV